MNPVDRTLLVVPYVGEFGWELMNWQGRVRRIIAGGTYGRVVVCARPDRRLLYASPPGRTQVVFCPIGHMNLPGLANEDHRVDEQGVSISPTVLSEIVEGRSREACEGVGIDVRAATLLAPDYRATLWPTTRTHQLFAEFHVQQAITSDVLLVPRRRHLAAERNQPESWWEDLASELERRGLSVECYESSLETAVHQLSRVRLAVGASTGGLHLASLCRCPHYVWGCGPETRWTRLGITNRQRYETLWNPLGTACRYDECGWRPTIRHVADNAQRALEAIGRVPGRSSSSWSLKPKWRVKRRLAGLMAAGPDRGWLPWRMRRLVRERIV